MPRFGPTVCPLVKAEPAADARFVLLCLFGFFFSTPFGTCSCVIDLLNKTLIRGSRRLHAVIAFFLGFVLKLITSDDYWSKHESIAPWWMSTDADLKLKLVQLFAGYFGGRDDECVYMYCDLWATFRKCHLPEPEHGLLVLFFFRAAVDLVSINPQFTK